jgi:hypothetical protein
VTPRAHGDLDAGNHVGIALRGLDAAAAARRALGVLSRDQGGGSVCFDAADPPAGETRCAANGMPASGVLPLERKTDGADGPATGHVERLGFDPADSPEGVIQAARHLSPHPGREPCWSAHPNGCDMLPTTIVSVTGLDRFARTYDAHLGPPAERRDGEARFLLPSGGSLRRIAGSRIAASFPP